MFQVHPLNCSKACLCRHTPKNTVSLRQKRKYSPHWGIANATRKNVTIFILFTLGNYLGVSAWYAPGVHLHSIIAELSVNWGSALTWTLSVACEYIVMSQFWICGNIAELIVWFFTVDNIVKHAICIKSDRSIWTSAFLDAFIDLYDKKT